MRGSETGRGRRRPECLTPKEVLEASSIVVVIAGLVRVQIKEHIKAFDRVVDGLVLVIGEGITVDFTDSVKIGAGGCRGFTSASPVPTVRRARPWGSQDSWNLRTAFQTKLSELLKRRPIEIH